MATKQKRIFRPTTGDPTRPVIFSAGPVGKEGDEDAPAPATNDVLAGGAPVLAAGVQVTASS